MNPAVQPARDSASYSLRTLAGDTLIGALALAELVIVAVVLGGATFYLPWVLFAPPVLFAAGYARGDRTGNPWLKALAMNWTPVLLIVRGTSVWPVLAGTALALVSLAVGIAVRRSNKSNGNRNRVLATLIPFVVFFVVAAGWIWYVSRTNGTVVSSGMTRRYLLYVPKSYDRAKPAPLIISLHPAASWPLAEEAISGWNQLADERGFLVVYPAGRNIPQIWPNGASSAAVDVQFISDLIDKLEGEYNIDRTRIYADGISNGGGMAFVLSCRLSQRIAAVGAVSAAQSLPSEWCGSAAPVPMMAFHGTADRFVPYRGGTSMVSGDVSFPDVNQWVKNWALRNHCGDTAIDAQVSSHVRRSAYSGCANNANVVLYTIEGGGHAWPGGKTMPEWIVGHTTHEISATRLMWDFFALHPLAGRTK